MVFFYLFVLMVGFAYIGRFVIEYECKITIIFGDYIRQYPKFCNNKLLFIFRAIFAINLGYSDVLYR